MGTPEIVQLVVQGGVGIAALFVLLKVVGMMLSALSKNAAHIAEMQDCFRESLTEVTTAFSAGLQRIEAKWDDAIASLEKARETAVRELRQETAQIAAALAVVKDRITKQ